MPCSPKFSCYVFYLQIRRLIQPSFQGSLPLKWGYHVATWTTTRLLLDFGSLPLEFMWWSVALRFWGSVERMHCVTHIHSSAYFSPCAHTNSANTSLFTNNRFYYYLPVVAVCVVAFLFPSGRSSGRKKPKSEPAANTTTTIAGNHVSASTSNDEVVVDKKTV